MHQHEAVEIKEAPEFKRLSTNKLKPGEFQLGSRVIQRAHTTLWCRFDHKSKPRRLMIHLIENRWFDRFIMTCILLNSLVMSMFDYQTDNYCAYKYG